MGQREEIEVTGATGKLYTVAIEFRAENPDLQAVKLTGNVHGNDSFEFSLLAEALVITSK